MVVKISRGIREYFIYWRLTWTNINRTLRDYIIYFITVALTATLMYSFLALGFSEDIISLSENMAMLTSGIVLMSVLIAFIASFVIGYAIRFILGQRKKEFALYELMGMETKAVCYLFLVEHIIIGGFAFLLGSLAGVGLSSVLNQLVKNIFDVPHSYRISFSLKAWVAALMYFILMYIFGMFRAVKIIRKQKVVDLLYDNRKNEELRIKSVSLSIFIVLVSIATLLAGLVLIGKGLHIQTNKALLYFSGACLLLFTGIYGVHRQFPFLLCHFNKQNPRRKYKGENLFYLGQIGRRIQSSGKTMAVVAILLTVSLATMFVGLTMGAGYKANMEAYYPYDVGVAIDVPLTKESMEPVLSFIKECCAVEDSLTYYLYSVPDVPIEALAISDYNYLRQLLGLSPVLMNDDEFLIHCDTWGYIDKIQEELKKQPEITLAGHTLTVAKTPIMTEPMEQHQMAGTGGYVLVLPDEVVQYLSGNKIRLAIKLKSGGYPELRSEIRDFINSNRWNPELQAGYEMPERRAIGVQVKAWGVENSLTGFTVISFCCLYLSIIFIILSCAVLAFEQLSAIDKNRKNYTVLDRLGVDRQKQILLIRRELSTVFLIPLLLPLLFTVVLIVGAQVLFSTYILQEGLILLYGLLTILGFSGIYFTYFGATLFIFKAVILNPM